MRRSRDQLADVMLRSHGDDLVDDANDKLFSDIALQQTNAWGIDENVTLYELRTVLVPSPSVILLPDCF